MHKTAPVNRMRILHLYQDFHPTRGGIEDLLLDLTRESQRAHGDEHVVVTAGAPGRTAIDEIEGVRVIRAATYGRYFTPLCPSWPRWVRLERPDVIHVHLPCPMAEATALLGRGLRRRPLVISLHNDYVRPRALLLAWGRAHRAALRRADRIVTSSADYATTSPALRGLLDRSVAIPPGLRLSDYETPDSQAVEAIRERHGKPLVVFLGRLCYYKGVETLIEAAKLMRQPASVVVIGDGPWRERLVRQAEGAAGYVHFAGPLPEDDAIAHLHAASVFAMPSTWRSEAFGIAQVKAMACGLPAVTTDLPGVSWVNRDGETGAVVPRREPRALAAALDRLLADDALRRRLGDGARRRAGDFTLARMVDSHRALYAELAG